MRVLFLFFTFFFSIFGSLYSQGIYKEFGQNRVQYRDFNWDKLTFNNIDIIYYDNEGILANNALQLATRELERLETFLSYKYGGAMQLVVFSNLNDYRQSNIGYTNPLLSSGGFLVIPNDVNTIYFDGSYTNLQMQLRKAICDIMLREMIYGGTLQDRFERVRSPMLPAWFTEGLGAFLSESWNADLENQMNNAISTNMFSNFNNLNPEETKLAGHSIWRYLVEAYGAEALSTIVFISRYTHSVDAAIYFHTRKNMGEFLKDWREFYVKNLGANPNQNLPRGKSNIPGRISKRMHTDMSLSPNGEKVAIVTNDRGRYDIWEFVFATGKVVHIYSGGVRVLNQLADYEFPKLKWNAASGELLFVTYENGSYFLMSYKNGHVKKTDEFAPFTAVLDFSISSDGSSMAFSGVKNGRTDLYIMDLKSKIINRITNDLFYDACPVFRKDGSVLFVSNRPLNKDSGFLGYVNYTNNIFEYTNGDIHPLTAFNQKVNLSSIIEYNEKTFGFLSDHSGIRNAYVVIADSGTQVFPQTNYKLGILNQSVSFDQKSLAELLLIEGRFNIFTSLIPQNPINESVPIQILKWKTTIENIDSLFADRNVRISNQYLNGNDSVSYSKLDSLQRSYKFQTGFEKVDYKINYPEDSSITVNHFKHGRFYNSLQPDFLLSQSENRVLGSYLFNNNIRRDALRNPLIMPYMKVSLADVLKNYIIEAGFRTSLDLLQTDYTSRFAVLKYRLDHELSISRHMRKFEDAGNVLKQNISIQSAYTLSLPLNERSRISTQFGARYEYLTIKGSESQNLDIPDIRDYYLTGNVSYIFDNTTSLGLNMMKGSRAAIGFDLYQKLNSDLLVNNICGDVRTYIPVYQKIIWANRLAFSYALGNGKVAYYLGAVENWTGKNQFAPYSQTLQNNTYVFQQWVSNLRGFGRGIRLGSSFAILNSELRIPVFQTFIKRPVESEFFRYFTCNIFSDIGTAFIGKSPADPENLFNTIYYSTPNYDISITSKRNPLVMGIGFGARTRFLGYFIKYDRGYGRIENTWLTPMNYISLGFDF
ncbi:MAG: PD40 domain-containing protein [Bacteroidetes bacterium]|nr:PD40 domain-containing protein [Bacteroidota bacterium]